MNFLELEETRNGTDHADWRDAAMNEALRGFDSGYSLQALMGQVRLHHPGCAVFILSLDRPQVLRFLRQEAVGFRSLLSGAVLHEENQEMWPYIGWYAATWEGEEIEIAMSPGYDEDDILCIARDEATVRRLNGALTEFAERPAGRCLHYAEGWKNAPHLEEEIGKVTWDDLVLPPDLLASVRESVEGFVRHREAYAALGFPWRRGVLLIGPPGTGKTMICKAAAAAVPDWPFLYVRDLREYHEEEAVKAIFERARKLAPCILAFEDLDGLVVDSNRTLFLNELDGFQNNEGLLILASSNHPEKIDEALLKRPSRFDRVFHVGLPGTAERREYCLRVLSRSSLAERLSTDLDVEALAAQVGRYSEGFTPAYLKEVFVGAALQRAQAGASVLDGQFAQAVMAQVEELRAHLRRMKDPEALSEMTGNDGIVGFRRHLRTRE